MNFSLCLLGRQLNNYIMAILYGVCNLKAIYSCIMITQQNIVFYEKASPVRQHARSRCNGQPFSIVTDSSIVNNPIHCSATHTMPTLGNRRKTAPTGRDRWPSEKCLARRNVSVAWALSLSIDKRFFFKKKGTVLYVYNFQLFLSFRAGLR